MQCRLVLKHKSFISIFIRDGWMELTCVCTLLTLKPTNLFSSLLGLFRVENNNIFFTNSPHYVRLNDEWIFLLPLGMFFVHGSENDDYYHFTLIVFIKLFQWQGFGTKKFTESKAKNPRRMHFAIITVAIQKRPILTITMLIK